MTPTPGWRNFDNSYSVRLSNWPSLVSVLSRLRFISATQLAFIRFCRDHDIQWADVRRRIPVASNSVDVLYTSHMFDYLDRTEAREFLREARRVLVPGGIIRIAITDLEKKILKYLADGDADAFVGGMGMIVPRTGTLQKRIQVAIVGLRQRRWMYDGNSLSRFLVACGFTDPTQVSAGESLIADPERLDLFERAADSLYVEAANGEAPRPKQKPRVERVIHRHYA